MSYCVLLKVMDDGSVEWHKEFRNAWGYAAFIWTKLFDEYAEKAHEYDSWMSDESSKKLWALANDDRLKEYERHVLASTFDSAMLDRKDFSGFVDALHAFHRKHAPGDSTCHLLDMAEEIGMMDEQAVCWYHTSVCEDPWFDYSKEEDDDGCPYNINDGKRHWFLDFTTPSGVPPIKEGEG